MVIKSLPLGSRYVDGASPVVTVDDEQRQIIDDINEKIESGVYDFETTDCGLCGATSFLEVARRDRYGIHHPVQICRECGLIQATPRMTEETVGTFYNTEYRELYTGDNWQEELFESQYENAEALHQFLSNTVEELPTHGTVLDVGCGVGGMLEYFEDQGWDAVGCDLDSRAVEFGRERGIRLFECSPAGLSLDETPDVVVLSHVVEHFSNPVESLTAVRELCGEDTIVYVEVPGVKQLSPFRQYYHSDFLQQLQNAHTYYFTSRTLRNLELLAGFDRTYGDEWCRSVLLPDAPRDRSKIQSDFWAVCRHLLWTEYGRRTKETVRNAVEGTPLFPAVQKVYQKIG